MPDKIKLDPEKFKTDERFSNHAVQGFSYPGCPIDKGCFGVGMGVPIPGCDYFEVSKEDKAMYCSHPAMSGGCLQDGEMKVDD